MPDQLFELNSQPGVRRDGTSLDSPFYNDAVWMRWQRGKPKKMGGYRAMATNVFGPVRSLLVDSRNGSNTVHSFSQWGIQRMQFSADGSSGTLEDRTPLAFSPDNRLSWSHGIMSSSTGGSYSALIAASTPDVLRIDSDEPGFIWSGDMATNEPLRVVSDANGPVRVSGGVCVLQPFLFAYGSNGLIRNSNANDFAGSSGWDESASGNANTANVAGTKFIHGAPVRGGGQSPAGLFWALDALVRVSYVGGQNLWSYDTLNSPTSILGKKSIVEHDGKFFWPGTDRFLFYNGVVQELPNQMNSNWFFENLNYAQRNKVWGTKIPRWGEIWWFYPRGNSEECDHAVIFNYLENTWYDAKKERSAGGPPLLFPYPIWAGSEDRMDTYFLPTGVRTTTTLGAAVNTNKLTLASVSGLTAGMSVVGLGVPVNTLITSISGQEVTLSNLLTAIVPQGSTVIFSRMTRVFQKGEIVTGATSGARATVVRAEYTGINIDNIVGSYTVGEVLNGDRSAIALLTSPPYPQQLGSIYQQETGRNKVVGAQELAIKASFTSKDFGFAVGQPFAEAAATTDIMTRVVRIEPDFGDTSGDLTMVIEGRDFAKRPSLPVATVPLSGDAPFDDIRDAQARILRVKIETNSLNGDLDQGKVILSLQPGDERSGEYT